MSRIPLNSTVLRLLSGCFDGCLLTSGQFSKSSVDQRAVEFQLQRFQASDVSFMAKRRCHIRCFQGNLKEYSKISKEYSIYIVYMEMFKCAACYMV